MKQDRECVVHSRKPKADDVQTEIDCRDSEFDIMESTISYKLQVNKLVDGIETNVNYYTSHHLIALFSLVDKADSINYR